MDQRLCLALCGVVGLGSVIGCALAHRGEPGALAFHTCYRIEHPASGEPAIIADGSWLLLSDESDTRLGARSYNAELVTGQRVAAVKWRRTSPDSLEIRAERESWQRLVLRVVGGRADGTAYATGSDVPTQRMVPLGRVTARRVPCEARSASAAVGTVT